MFKKRLCTTCLGKRYVTFLFVRRPMHSCPKQSLKRGRYTTRVLWVRRRNTWHCPTYRKLVSDPPMNYFPAQYLAFQRLARRNKYYSLEEVGKVFEELKASKLQNPAERKAYIESRKAARDQHNSVSAYTSKVVHSWIVWLQLYCRARYWVENYDLREKDVLCANRAKAWVLLCDFSSTEANCHLASRSGS